MEPEDSLGGDRLRGARQVSTAGTCAQWLWDFWVSCAAFLCPIRPQPMNCVCLQGFEGRFWDWRRVKATGERVGEC